MYSRKMNGQNAILPVLDDASYNQAVMQQESMHFQLWKKCHWVHLYKVSLKYADNITNIQNTLTIQNTHKKV